MALEVPPIVTAKDSRRLIGKEAAAEMQLAPLSRRKGAVQPSTSREATRVAHPASDDREPAIVTIRRTPERILPPGLLPETPEEHQRRCDVADAMWRELLRRATGKRP